MSEKEKRIVTAILKAVKIAPQPKKDYLLGWAEGAASMIEQSIDTKAPAQQAHSGAASSLAEQDSA